MQIILNFNAIETASRSQITVNRYAHLPHNNFEYYEE
jgi:hypothetical protein